MANISKQEVIKYLLGKSKEICDDPIIFIDADDKVYSILLEKEFTDVSITVSIEIDETYVSIYSNTAMVLTPKIVNEAITTFWNDTTDIDIMASIEIVKSRKVSVDQKIKTVMQPLQQRAQAYMGCSIEEFLKQPFSFEKLPNYVEFSNYLVVKTGTADFSTSPTVDAWTEKHKCLLDELKQIYGYVVAVLV